MPIEIRELIIKATVVDDEFNSVEKSTQNIDIDEFISQIKDEIIDEITYKVMENIEKQKNR